jgi:NAD(P)-dependent dehydrogenase (short-subunit alcohol dehydrogenase family)
VLLDGKVAVVTGGTRGIGRATVETFLSHGASVVFAGKGERIEELQGAFGAKSLGVRCDVRSEDDVDELMDSAVRRFGSIDILVNNAGIARDAMVHRMELSDFLEVLDVNLVGTWLCSRAALRRMRERGGGGTIVNVSSISAKAGNLGQGNYAASKAAVVALTKTIAREGARRGIRANAIRPGLIETDMTGSLDPAARARLMTDIPLGRPGLPAEVAQAALFLASDMSSYITGSVLDVSGGRQM